jgi:hypothetical protein
LIHVFAFSVKEAQLNFWVGFKLEVEVFGCACAVVEACFVGFPHEHAAYARLVTVSGGYVAGGVLVSEFYAVINIHNYPKGR